MAIQLLKKEMATRGLSTTGNKVKLQLLLREAMEAEDVHINRDVEKEEAVDSAKDLEQPSTYVEKKAIG